MAIDQLKFHCKRCNCEASSVKKDDMTYTVKCANESCELSLRLVHPHTVNLSLPLATLQDNLRDYFIVEQRAMDTAIDLRVWLFCEEHGPVGTFGPGGAMVGCDMCTVPLLVFEVTDEGEFKHLSSPRFRHFTPTASCQMAGGSNCREP